MKVVINTRYGGFGLSDAAHQKLIEWGIPAGWLTGKAGDDWDFRKRDHPLLVRVVEEMGAAADGVLAILKVVEVPDGVEYEIEECNGVEHVAEKHRTWG